MYSIGNGEVEIGHSLVEGGWDGPGVYSDGVTVTETGGNIDADPLFAAPITATAAPTRTGDYRLLSMSPAVDAGNNFSVTSLVDLDGNPRLSDVPIITDTGNGTAPLVDIGAYEVQWHLLRLAKDVTPTDGLDRQQILTYSLSLSNRGVASDTNVVLTDALPHQLTFGGWIDQPGYALAVDDVITWTGTVRAHDTLTFAFWARREAGFGTISNVASFSGTTQTGQARATVLIARSLYLPVMLRQ